MRAYKVKIKICNFVIKVYNLKNKQYYICRKIEESNFDADLLEQLIHFAINLHHLLYLFGSY